MKTCVTCKWYEEKGGEYLDSCTNLQLRQNKEAEATSQMIRGRSTSTMAACWQARLMSTHGRHNCGPEGALWEAKECEAKTE
jgi:hypothetical protein